MVTSIEFFEGIAEELTDVSLRRRKDTGNRTVLMTFAPLKALEKFTTSFTERSHGKLHLIDSEGEISIEPSSLKFVYGGEEGEDIQRVECSFEIEREDHWERFMRFMHSYAEEHGMGYQEKGQGDQ